MADEAGSEKAVKEPPQDQAAPEKTEAKPEQAKAPAGEAPKTKKATPPPSEDQIDSPDRKTLILLFAIFAVTVSSWGAARFSCNMHPPESKPPPKLTTDRLAANAKDAAIEFTQRAKGNDFDGALELAVQGARAEVETSRADCQKNASDCARKREAMAGLLTTAVVQRQDGFTADATATTYFKGEKKNYRLKLTRENTMWKVSEFSPEPNG